MPTEGDIVSLFAGPLRVLVFVIDAIPAESDKPAFHLEITAGLRFLKLRSLVIQLAFVVDIEPADNAVMLALFAFVVVSHFSISYPFIVLYKIEYDCERKKNNRLYG